MVKECKSGGGTLHGPKKKVWEEFLGKNGAVMLAGGRKSMHLFPPNSIFVESIYRTSKTSSASCLCFFCCCFFSYSPQIWFTQRKHEARNCIHQDVPSLHQEGLVQKQHPIACGRTQAILQHGVNIQQLKWKQKEEVKLATKLQKMNRGMRK